MLRLSLLLLLILALLFAACDKTSGGGMTCGLAAIAGPTALLNEFSVPHQTLAEAPARLPERLVARLVAGPSLPAFVGRADSAWVIGIEGAPPPDMKPGYGVLVLDPSSRARGVMVYQGLPVEGAPEIGTVTITETTMPLIGIEVDPARFEDPRCPFFPDSVLR
jgi:hypothetical protein